MTDKEAYDLMVKYGGPKVITMLTEMIHLVGVEQAVNNIIQVWPREMPDDFKFWMYQSACYIKNQIGKQMN